MPLAQRPRLAAVSSRGPKPDTVTIGGITKTYEEWGRPIGLQKESFRHRVIKMGVDHPLLLKTKAELCKLQRAEKAKRERASYIERWGMTPEERRAKMQKIRSGRYIAKRKEKSKARREVLRLGGTGTVDGMMAEDGTDNDEWRKVCEDELAWRERTTRASLKKAQKRWGELTDEVLEHVSEYRDGASGVWSLMVALALEHLEDEGNEQAG